MIPHADKLIEQAQKGQRLNSKERRHCVAYLMSTQPATTNVANADLFQVSERQIRLDKKYIREDRAKLIREDDIGLVIADIAMSFETQVRDMEASKQKCKRGTRVFLEHCRVIFDTQIKKVNALQALGFYPRNLGNIVVEKFDYRAVVSKDGSVNTRAVDMIFDDDDTIDLPVKQQPRLNAAE
jgi:hypothetical protein